MLKHLFPSSWSTSRLPENQISFQIYFNNPAKGNIYIFNLILDADRSVLQSQVINVAGEASHPYHLATTTCHREDKW